MKTSDLLIEARKEIASPLHWTQGIAARDAEGEPCWPSSPTAVCFCSIGALERTSAEFAVAHALGPAKVLLRKVMGMGVVMFNDSHTHAEVMAAWDNAIILAKSQGD